MYVGWIYQWRYRASTGQQSVKLSLDELSFVIVVLMHWLIGFSAQKKEEKKKRVRKYCCQNCNKLMDILTAWQFCVMCRPSDIHRLLIPCNASAQSSPMCAFHHIPYLRVTDPGAAATWRTFACSCHHIAADLSQSLPTNVCTIKTISLFVYKKVTPQSPDLGRRGFTILVIGEFLFLHAICASHHCSSSMCTKWNFCYGESQMIS